MSKATKTTRKRVPELNGDGGFAAKDAAKAFGYSLEQMSSTGGFYYPPKKTYTLTGILFNWLTFLAIIIAVCIAWRYIDFSFPALSGWQVVLFGFCFAFVWVENLKWLHHTKPFNCLACMSGWSTLIFALMFHVEPWYMYMFVGVFAGALFNGIKNRYL